MFSILKSITLVYLIIIQDGINMQAGKFPKINKHSEYDKAVQVGIFKKITTYYEKHVFWKFFQNQ